MTVNKDPDGLECYSDHANDILSRGECMFCTSTDVNVVGHVLPDVTRMKGLDPVQAAAVVLKTQSVTMFDGILLDHWSASAIQQVYDALSTKEARAKLRAMSLPKAVDTVFRVIKKAQEGR